MKEEWKKEISLLIEKYLKEPWMTDIDFNIVLEETVSHLGGWDNMEKDINVGVENGFPFEKTNKYSRSNH